VWNEHLGSLSNLVGELTTRANARLPHGLSPPPALARGTQPTVAFAALKFTKTTKKFRHLCSIYFTDAANLVAHVMATMVSRRHDGLSVLCSVEQLHAYFLSGYDKDMPIKAATDKLRSLRAFIEHYGDSPRFPELPVDHLRAILKESVSAVSESIEFSPFGFFDTFFSYFVRGHTELSLARFEACARSVWESASPSGAINCSVLSQLILDCVQLIKPRDQMEVMVIKHAVYRVFFDELFLIAPALFESTDDQMADSGRRLLRLTPRQLSISEKLVQSDTFDVPFGTIIESSRHLKHGIANCELTMFLINPVDIMVYVFNSLKSVEEFVRENCPVAETGTDIAAQLAFDDVFPFFCGMFAAACPLNARAIGDLLSRANGFDVASALDFAKLIFTSAVEYVGKLDTAEFDRLQSL
jgi:hypothetical protein